MLVKVDPKNSSIKPVLARLTPIIRERVRINFITLQVPKIATNCNEPLHLNWGWSGGEMVLGKLPVAGHPTNLDYSRAKAYCACSGCRWGLLGHFFSRLSFLFSFSLSLGDGPI